MIVGVLGAGQLGRMLALAGLPLGLRFRFWDQARETPAGQLAECLHGPWRDALVLDRFLQDLTVVTYESENIPHDLASRIAEQVAIYPPPPALHAAQDRLHEKTLFRRLDIPTPPFVAVGTREELEAGAADPGLPAVLKTRRFGYDGKGQFVLRQPGDVEQAWSALGGAPLLLEQLVTFEREVSILAVRDRAGQTAFYPLVENRHEEGILRRSEAPAPNLTVDLQTEAETYAQRILEATGYVGVLAIEFFQVGGRLLANEMAPRVHNSGHWTIEGAVTSQFENHLRAILGLPLGPTAARGRSVMLNLIGSVPPLGEVLSQPGAHLHSYGKAPRPGRKLGHITYTEADGRRVSR